MKNYSIDITHDRLFHTVEIDGIRRHIDVPPNRITSTIDMGEALFATSFHTVIPDRETILVEADK